jgi:hypothetical protein
MSENSFVYMACGACMYTKNCQDRSANERAHNGLIYSAFPAHIVLPKIGFGVRIWLKVCVGGGAHAHNKFK